MDEERYGDWIVELNYGEWIVLRQWDNNEAEIQCHDHESATELAKSLARNAV